MSLYREARGRSLWPIAFAAVVSLAAGLGIGLLLGGSDEGPAPSVEAAVASLQREIRPALSALELVAIEYGDAVRNGEVVEQTEYEAAEAHLAEARRVFDALRTELELLDPQAARQAATAIQRLEPLIERRTEPGAVGAQVEDARERLSAAARLAPAGPE